jgi:hypothetical protein
MIQSYGYELICGGKEMLINGKEMQSPMSTYISGEYCTPELPRFSNVLQCDLGIKIVI